MVKRRVVNSGGRERRECTRYKKDKVPENGLNTHEQNFVIKVMNKSFNEQKFEPWT